MVICLFLFLKFVGVGMELVIGIIFFGDVFYVIKGGIFLVLSMIFLLKIVFELDVSVF